MHFGHFDAFLPVYFAAIFHSISEVGFCLFPLFHFGVALCDHLDSLEFDFIDAHVSETGLLYLFCSFEDFECVLVGIDFEVAFGEGGEEVSVV